MSTGHRLPIYRIIYRFSKIIILPSSLPITPHPAPSAHRTILDMINMICQRVSDESWFKKVLSFRWNCWSLKKNLGSALKNIINNHHTTSVETFPIQHDRSLQHYENPLPLPSFRNKRNSVSICVCVTAFLKPWQSIPIFKKVIRLYIIFVDNDPIIKEELIESICPLLLTDL